jgi:hypothetical protein
MVVGGSRHAGPDAHMEGIIKPTQAQLPTLPNGRMKKGYHGYVDRIRPIPGYLVGVACTLRGPRRCLLSAVSFSRPYLSARVEGDGGSEREVEAGLEQPAGQPGRNGRVQTYHAG